MRAFIFAFAASLALALPSSAQQPAATQGPQPAAEAAQQPQGAAVPQPPQPIVQEPSIAPQPAATRTLTLDEAVKTARARQPTLRQAQATTAAARARVDQAGAPLYPQVNFVAGYQRMTGNFVPRAGSIPSGVGGNRVPDPDFDTFDYINFGLSANQLIWDFGQTTGRKHAAEATVEAQEQNETATLLSIDQNVRVAFFNARAAKELLAVARETLDNYERHLAQIAGFVAAGTRAEIDLAQARTDRANARVSLINAENSYASSKAALNQAMGVEGSTEYDVADESISPVAGEDGALEKLVDEAIKTRPEFASLQKQILAQEKTLDAIAGTRLPSLGATAGATEAGNTTSGLVWNFSAGVNLNWPIYAGGISNAQSDEVQANIVGLRAQEDTLRQQVRVDVEQAQLAVRAAKAALEASDEAVTNARERRRLAEGRYQIGVGNGLELADAELAQTSSLAQRVQAEYTLSSARARLLRALGAP
jgi:outer membrane protein